MTNVADALCDLLHAVLVNVGVVVQLSEILDNAKTLSLFFRDTEKWRTVERVGSFDNSQF